MVFSGFVDFYDFGDFGDLRTLPLGGSAGASGGCHSERSSLYAKKNAQSLPSTTQSLLPSCFGKWISTSSDLVPLLLWQRVGNGLALVLQRVGTGLALVWQRVGNRLATKCSKFIRNHFHGCQHDLLDRQILKDCRNK